MPFRKQQTIKKHCPSIDSGAHIQASSLCIFCIIFKFRKIFNLSLMIIEIYDKNAAILIELSDVKSRAAVDSVSVRVVHGSLFLDPTRPDPAKR